MAGNQKKNMTTTLETKDCQQAISGFKTVAIIGCACGPVQILEALDTGYSVTKHRYFIAVNFKFRKSDALNIGKPGWLGCTKSEATREAHALAARLNIAAKTLEGAKAAALNWDTFTNRFTVKMQQENLDKILNRYSAELEAA